jgi:hypothetical protein
MFIRPQRSRVWAVSAWLWRFRVELWAALVAVVGWWSLNHRLGHLGAWAVLVGLVLVVTCVTPVRRWVVSHVWCTLTRHRLRSCLVQVRAMNYDGLLPLCVWVRPTKVGEKVWLWMRAGLSVSDLTNHDEQLAAACWAREARVSKRRSNAAVVIVEIIRRDPLQGSKLLTNPLVGLADIFTMAGRSKAPIVEETPPGETELKVRGWPSATPGMVAWAQAADRVKSGHTRPGGTPAPAGSLDAGANSARGPVVPGSDEDVSDYL